MSAVGPTPGRIDAELARRARAFGIEPSAIDEISVGLINRTYRITSDSGSVILQRVNEIFSPQIHHNIAAVTDRLSEAGLTTPRLVPTSNGALWLDDADDAGRWRALTLVPGATFNRVIDAQQAANAAAFLARWHAALEGIDHAFVGMRSGVHDTPRHLAHLARSVAEHRGHRLHDAAARLADQILRAASELPSMDSLEDERIIGHGDPKLNNLLFAASEPPGCYEPVAWIDLDTVGPLALAHELGDMWRSWCNRAGEDEDAARFDLETFAASARGYFSTRRVSDAAAADAAVGLDWISLELSARFCADALEERYFGWSAERFAGRGEHNLHRARGQYSLFEAAEPTRRERANAIERARAAHREGSVA
jgi:Ser/Thr protein kinase RdoA (MazF antagonist)